MDGLTAEAVLSNVQRRYLHDAIYTNVSSILIAVNPYHSLSALYDDSVLRFYHGLPPSSPPPPPHIFAIARSAYLRALGRESGGAPCSQSILISGESGAGKTEATKHILTYLVYASSASSLSSSGTVGSAAFQQAASSSVTRHIEHRLLNANPILEAFGNAKTLRNDNSSRFGKWLQLELETGTGRITAGSVQHYLLESSRVVAQGQGERNYNIFYHLLAHRRQRPADFRYLSGSGCETVPGLDERAMYDGVVQAMTVIGMSSARQQQVMDTVLAILHLGNVEFTATPLQSGKEGCDISAASQPSLQEAARLFRLRPAALSAALTTRVLVSPRSTIINMPRSVKEAEETRDSMAKAVYSRLMTALIAGINASLTPSPPASSAASSAPAAATVRLGLLDIFGFEVFPFNSLEQLLINYANERLHSHFLQQVFRLERETYAAEGVELSAAIAFQDNQPAVDLLDRKPAGVLPLLHDELFVPRGSDELLLAKLHAAHEKHSCYVRPRMGGDASGRFGIAHYAATVEYSVKGMLDKNRSSVGQQIVALFAASEGELMKDMFGLDDDDEEEAAAAAGGAAQTGAQPAVVARGRRNTKPSIGQLPLSRPSTPPPKSRSASVSSAGSSAALSSSSRSSISSLFLQSMAELLSSINSSQPHFVRCIKPNACKSPRTADSALLLSQLSSSGVIDAVRVRRDGYSERMPIPAFLKRYLPLVQSEIRTRGMQRSADRDKVQLIMETVAARSAERLSRQQAGSGKARKQPQEKAETAGRSWQLGRTRVLYKTQLHTALEVEYGARQSAAAVLLQARIRGWIVRRRQRAVSRLWKELRAALAAGSLSDVDALLSSSVCQSSLPAALLSSAQRERSVLASGTKASDALLQSLSIPASSLSDRCRLLDAAIAMAEKTTAAPHPSWYPHLQTARRAAVEVRAVLRTVEAALKEADDAACEDEKASERLEAALQQSEAAIAAAVAPVSRLSLCPPLTAASALSALTEVAAGRSALLRLQRVADELQRSLERRELAELHRALQDGDREGLRWPVMREGRVCHQALTIANDVDAALEKWTVKAITGAIAALRGLLPRAPAAAAAASSPSPASPLDAYFPAGVSISSLLALLDASLVALQSELEARSAAQSALQQRDHFKLTMAIQRAEDALYMQEHSRRTVKGAKIVATAAAAAAAVTSPSSKLKGKKAAGPPRDLQQLVAEMKVECGRLERMARDARQRDERQQAAVEALRAAQTTEDEAAIEAAIGLGEEAAVSKELLAQARSHLLTVRTIALLTTAIDSRRIDGSGGLREALAVSSSRLHEQALDVRSREYQDRHQQAQAVLDMLLAVDRVRAVEQETVAVSEAREGRRRQRQQPASEAEEEKEEAEWAAAVEALRDCIAAARLLGARDSDIPSALCIMHEYDALHPQEGEEREAEERRRRQREDEAKAREKQRIIDRLRPQLNGGVRVLLPSAANSPPLRSADAAARKTEDEKEKQRLVQEERRRQEDAMDRAEKAAAPLPPGGPSLGLQYAYDAPEAEGAEPQSDNDVDAAISAALKRTDIVGGVAASGGAAESVQLERVVRLSGDEWCFAVSQLENDDDSQRQTGRAVAAGGRKAVQPARDGEMIATKPNKQSAGESGGGCCSCCCCCVIA